MTLLPAASEWPLCETRVLPVRPPYRLDLTAAALRRTPLNPVDIITGDGTYLRAAGPTTVCAVRQQPDGLELRVYGEPAAVPDFTLTLGTQVDLAGFYAAARAVPALASLAERAVGVRPPRYPSLWEAVCNTVVFQQVSLQSATAIMGRVVGHFSPPVTFGEDTLRPFPSPALLRDAEPELLRSLGLSAAKARTLKAVAATLTEGRLTAEELTAVPTAQAVERLTREPGIGPWTATVVMLRGFGRLDVFPLVDSGARRGLRALLGDDYAGDDPDASSVLEALGPWRGMLYYHLLLLRLDRQGLIRLAGRAAAPHCNPWE